MSAIKLEFILLTLILGPKLAFLKNTSVGISKKYLYYSKIAKISVANFMALLIYKQFALASIHKHVNEVVVRLRV